MKDSSTRFDVGLAQALRLLTRRHAPGGKIRQRFAASRSPLGGRCRLAARWRGEHFPRVDPSSIADAANGPIAAALAVVDASAREPGHRTHPASNVLRKLKFPPLAP